ncbi:cupin domain-containing protein [Vibrio taketomensis]|uniref:cupin domain-containing protein n=1 Tax=Vibrio taketomensis TaxID=2572923 RepID=UPI0022B2A349|nr:cupin domain-containing protein [Vibrio taketomensis]
METLINADFSQRVVIRPSDYQWVNSPMPGVTRMMLDRVGSEVSRHIIGTLSAHSEFSSHIHGGGEEFYVLEECFLMSMVTILQAAIRNPIGTSHTPRIGSHGAVIFVKLHQFDQHDQQRVNIDTNSQCWQQGLVNGLQVMPLHSFGSEHISLVSWAPNTQFKSHQHWGGEEILCCLYMMNMVLILKAHGYVVLTLANIVLIH